MRTILLASTAILAIAAPAHAEDIATKRTTPVKTSTVKNGAPDSVTITKDGSVVVTSGTAVTMDSNNAVTNKGTVTIGNASNATGILAENGTSGAIDNSGTITIDEPYAPTDADNDGDLDGPFALGSNRFGILTAGTHTGAITNSGTITVEGNDSAGIWLGGTQNGKLRTEGSIKVIGDRSTGLYAQDVNGDVRLAGSVSVQGEDAVGAHFAGDISGQLEIQGTIVATGYRYTTVPSDPSKLDADDLLQGGSAVVIEGDVSGGVIFAIPPKDQNTSNNDEDGDGIEDSKEGTAKIASYGAAPAVVIGAAGKDIAIGPVQSTAAKYGLQIDGSILGAGLYTGVEGNGLVIGGQGGNVTIANGIGITGSVGATSKDASATGLRLGAGAITPKLQNSGTISAGGGSAASAKTTAVKIDAGAQLGTISNSGTIKAVAAGNDGSATAILDSAGTVTLVENSGAIEASGAAADSTRNIAIDLSASTADTTIKQTVVASGKTAPSIKGDIRFGSGNDTLDLGDGTFTGDAYFGSGTGQYALSGDARHTGDVRFGGGNDTMSLAGTSGFNGTADFGGGNDTLTIADAAYFTGALANSSSLAVNLTGGTLDLRSPSSMASLTVGANGILVATLDKDAGEGSLYNIGGTASFADGAKLGVRLVDIYDAEGSYTVLQAGTLNGAADLELATGAIPFVFKASFGTPANANQIVVDIARRNATELGFNRSQEAAYGAIFNALANDEDIEQVFLGIYDGDQFRATVNQMLPDHAGGTFDGISMGSRAFARQVADAPSPVYSVGGVDVILSSAVWSGDKDIGDTAAYDLNGLGFSAAGEVDTKLGAFGLSATWLWNKHKQGSATNSVLSNTYELGAYWRGHWDRFTTFARGSIGLADMGGWRTFVGMADDDKIDRRIRGEWGGTLLTASAGAAYEFGGQHFFARPAVSVDYVSLDEDGYTETGGGEALDLTVEGRKSDEFAVNGGMTVGLDFMGNGERDRNWFRTEAEGGWREIVGGQLGSTTATFENGTAFTLDPELRSNGWYARLRAIGGSDIFELSGEVGAEDRDGNTALTLRGSLRLGF